MFWLLEKKSTPFVRGLILGFLCFKPIVAILIPYFFFREDNISRKLWLLGVILTIFINYVYFIFDYSLFLSFLQQATCKTHAFGYFCYFPHVYPWFMFIIIYFVEDGIKKRLMKTHKVTFS